MKAFILLSTLILSSVIFIERGSSKPEKRNEQKLKTVSAHVGSKKIEIEVADTDETRTIGLMNRLSMPPDHGMLFIFEEEEKRNFWMKETFLPLSIGFFDKNCALVDIQEMKPVKSLTDVEIPKYESRFPAKFALEMNTGWFKKNKIKLKDQLSLSPHCPKSH